MRTTSHQRLAFWSLAALALPLNAGIVALAVFLEHGRPAEPPAAPRRLVLPFEDTPDVWELFRRWVIQEDGRNKPFDTYCRETVRAVTGRERFEERRSRVTGQRLAVGHEPVAVVVSWMLSDASSPAGDWEHYPFLYCPSMELPGLLRPGESGTHVSPAALRQSEEFVRLLRHARQMLAEDSKAPLPLLEAAAMDVQGRLDLYDRIRAGGAFGVVALDQVGPTWFGLASVHTLATESSATAWEFTLQRRRLDHPTLYEGTPCQVVPTAEAQEVLTAFTSLRAAYRAGEAGRFAAAADDFLETVKRVSGHFNRYPDTDTVEMELWYNRTNPFRKAWLLGLLAFPLLGASLLVGTRWPQAGKRLYGAGLLAYLGLLAWAVVGFYCRVLISGRAPVSNMYESLIWVAFGTAGFGLALEMADRRRVIALAAVVVATLGLILADGLPLTFSPAIQPLQAVLRSNYWLVVHVLVIVSSYAPFALAWGLGNINLLLILYAPDRKDLVRVLSGFCYRAIQVGVLLLFLGTMLGGFWAAESWGRFWGWDPKEVWALIALLCYVIPLHARYVGWVGDFGLAVCSVVCFASVVMAWYGVNFVLGAGLHSYGFGSGEHGWVNLVGLINLDLVLLATLRYRAQGMSNTPLTVRKPG